MKIQQLVPIEISINVEEMEIEESDAPKKLREITYTEEIDLQQNAEEAFKLTVSFNFLTKKKKKQRILN